MGVDFTSLPIHEESRAVAVEKADVSILCKFPDRKIRGPSRIETRTGVDQVRGGKGNAKWKGRQILESNPNVDASQISI